MGILSFEHDQHNIQNYKQDNECWRAQAYVLCSETHDYWSYMSAFLLCYYQYIHSGPRVGSDKFTM